MYQDVTSIDGGSCLELRASCIFVFAGGAFAFVFGLVAAFGCGFLVGCHGEVYLLSAVGSPLSMRYGVALVRG